MRFNDVYILTCMTYFFLGLFADFPDKEDEKSGETFVDTDERESFLEAL